jgi:DNA transposition AAA+ family ATPase
MKNLGAIPALTGWRPGTFPHVELVLSTRPTGSRTTGLEQLRDLYDRHQLGLVLIGMPGLHPRRRLEHDAQDR